MTIKKIATVPGTTITYWQIGTEVHRAMTEHGVEANGMPRGTRWEAPLATWLHYLKAGAFPGVELIEEA